MRMVLFITVIFLILFGLQFLVYSTFRNFIQTKNLNNKLRIALTVYPFIIFNLPFLYLIINRIFSADTPEWVSRFLFPPFYIFQSATVFIGLYLLIGKIIKSPFSLSIWILNKFSVTKESLKKFFGSEPVKKIDSSRRAFIRTSATFVSGYAFAGATLGVLDKNDYEIENVEIKIKDLPHELKGTTLTLISDIHSGPYMDINLMREYTDVINDLKSDIIVIPGDLTNSNKLEVHPLANAFRNLKAPKGIFGSLGNHDYFSDAEYIASVISNETPVKLLRNNSEFININGKDLIIIGCEDTRQSNSSSDPVLMKYFNNTFNEAEIKAKEKNLDFNNLPKLVLFHKPYFFEEMNKRNPDLILSGHTHGGQVVLAKFGNINLSFAGAVSKYISGLYEFGNSSMYVSRGIGSVGLPIRFNCKPEITKITLI